MTTGMAGGARKLQHASHQLYTLTDASQPELSSQQSVSPLHAPPPHCSWLSTHASKSCRNAAAAKVVARACHNFRPVRCICTLRQSRGSCFTQNTPSQADKPHWCERKLHAQCTWMPVVTFCIWLRHAHRPNVKVCFDQNSKYCQLFSKLAWCNNTE
jgi:hypothetical protein